MATQGPMELERQEDQVEKKQDLQSEYQELLDGFKNLGIEPTTTKPKNWKIFGEEVVNQSYVDSLNREYHQARLAQETEANIQKWQAMQETATQIDEAFESLLEANKEKEYSSLDEFTEAHDPQLTEEQLAIFEHQAMQGVDTIDLEVKDGEHTGKFFVEDKNKVTPFKESERSEFEFSRNPFAKGLLNQYKKVQAHAVQQLDKAEQAQQAGKDSFEDRVRHKPKV